MKVIKLMHRISAGIYRKYLNRLLWMQFFAGKRRTLKNAPEPEVAYSICITTFLLRYENYFKPVIKKLAYLFHDLDLIVIANGHHDQAAQQQYLNSLEQLLADYPNVRLIRHQQPRGLSHLWNQAVAHSRYERVFILNDDIDIAVTLRRELERSGALDYPLVTNNGSWSQFLINKALFSRVGPFDEGLKEIGGEDDDYLVRMKLMGLEDRKIPLRSIWSVRKNKITVNSYGKEMKKQKGGYSTYNTEYLENKWEKSSAPADGAVFVRGAYWKPRHAAKLIQPES